MNLSVGNVSGIRIDATSYAHLMSAFYINALSRTSKASSPADTFLQFFHHLHVRRVYPLNDQLCHPIPFFDLEIRLRVVKEQDLDLPSIIRVNDSRPGVDEVLGREARPRCYAAICRESDNSLMAGSQ